MKTLLLATFLLLPCPLQAADTESARDFGKTLCDIIDGYKPGSYHYFDCLDTNLKVAATTTSNLVVTRQICSAAREFYSFSETEALRCFEDGLDLLIKGAGQAPRARRQTR